MKSIAQHCNTCNELKVFKFIGMQERLRGDDLPLYNCIECKTTQVNSSDSSRMSDKITCQNTLRGLDKEVYRGWRE